MKITIENTARLVEVRPRADGKDQLGRIWRGTLEDGTPVELLVLRVALRTDAPAAAHRQLEENLRETAAPAGVELGAFPARLVL